MVQLDEQVFAFEYKFVYKLQKPLYELRQSSRVWYQKLDNFFL